MADPSDNTTPEEAEVSEEEVDALLDKESGEAGAAAPGVPQPYDLVAPDKIVRGRMPALDRVNERWVGEFREELTELVRRPLTVELEDVRIMAYGEWQAALPSPVSLSVFTVKPWQGSALVAVDGALTYVLVDSYYGGVGGADRAVREALTPTEDRLNRILVDALTRHFQQAFEPVASIQFGFLRTEINPHYASIATPSEPVVITSLKISDNEVGGTVSLVLQLSLLEPVRERLDEGLTTVSPESRERWQQSIRSQLEHTQLELATVFLETQLSMKELLGLKPGDILPIEMPKTTTLYAGEKPLLRCKFGRSRGYNAVSIIEAIAGPLSYPIEEVQGE